VTLCEQNASSSATPKTISAVDDSCIISPFTRVRSVSACGSGISSAVTAIGRAAEGVEALAAHPLALGELDVARRHVVAERGLRT
jgi:hypothetical protein